MTFAALLLLAIGLALDGIAVAATRGAAMSQIRIRDALAVGMLFGGFHVIMPLAGWFAGTRALAIIARWDHWLAFALLGAIGTKMVWEARRAIPAESSAAAPLRLRGFVTLAFATSIDAFAVGITLPVLAFPVIASVATIGGVAALACAGGLYAGHHSGARLHHRFGALGGLVLIAIAVKILVEHLTAGA